MYPDKKKIVVFLCHGPRYAFGAVIKCKRWDTKESKNNFSARSQPPVLIQKRMWTVFMVPLKNLLFPYCRANLFGVVTGRYSDKKILTSITFK